MQKSLSKVILTKRDGVSRRDLSIAPGEIVGILGPNGAGKSTLFSTIVGVQPAFSGTVHLDGEDLSRLPAYKRARKKVALVPEGRQVLTMLTVRDNMDLTRSACPGDSMADYHIRLAEVFALFPRLKERQRQLSGTLSGGEQQMLAVAPPCQCEVRHLSRAI